MFDNILKKRGLFTKSTYSWHRQTPYPLKLVKAHAIGVNHLLLSRGFLIFGDFGIQEQKANASSLCNYFVIP